MTSKVPLFAFMDLLEWVKLLWVNLLLRLWVGNTFACHWVGFMMKRKLEAIERPTLDPCQVKFYKISSVPNHQTLFLS